MTIQDLYNGMLAKGWKPHAMEVLVLKFRSAGAIETMRLLLELNRREIFRLYYGEKADDVPLNEWWFGQLRCAQKAYQRGEIEREIDYILTHPNP